MAGLQSPARSAGLRKPSKDPTPPLRPAGE